LAFGVLLSVCSGLTKNEQIKILKKTHLVSARLALRNGTAASTLVPSWAQGLRQRRYPEKPHVARFAAALTRHILQKKTTL
jgi:hypothetical protein